MLILIYSNLMLKLYTRVGIWKEKVAISVLQVFMFLLKINEIPVISQKKILVHDTFR